MNCEAYRKEFEESALDAGVSAAATHHLEACAACREFLRERTALRSLLGSLKRVEAPSDFDFRLRARIRARGAAPRRSLVGRLLTPSASTALAACFVLALATAIYVRQSESALPNKSVSSISGAGSISGAQTLPAKNETNGDAANQSTGNETPTVQTAATVRNEATSNPSERGGVSESNRTKRVRVEKRNDFALSGADILTRQDSGEGEVAHLTRPVPVSLSASNQTLKVVLRDERGASRVVSMRPVSFGSQQFVGQAGNSFRASNASKEGVW